MKHIFMLVLVFCGCIVPAFPQAFDSTIQDLIEKYGGKALEGYPMEAGGSIQYADDSTGAFTLTANKRTLRFEIRKAGETLTTIRQDGRSQVSRGEKVDYPARSPRSVSAINLLPILALLEFRDDARFAGSLSEEGKVSGVKFAEGTPAGFKDLLQSRPKLTVTFWLDDFGRIERIVYAEQGRKSATVTYRYSYDSNVPGIFLQPSKITCQSDSRPLWTAAVSGTKSNITVSADFFKILETRERIK